MGVSLIGNRDQKLRCLFTNCAYPVKERGRPEGMFVFKRMTTAVLDI